MSWPKPLSTKDIKTLHTGVWVVATMKNCFGWIGHWLNPHGRWPKQLLVSIAKTHPWWSRCCKLKKKCFVKVWILSLITSFSSLIFGRVLLPRDMTIECQVGAISITKSNHAIVVSGLCVLIIVDVKHKSLISVWWNDQLKRQNLKGKQREGRELFAISLQGSSLWCKFTKL